MNKILLLDNYIGNGIKNFHNDKLTKILKIITEIGDKKFVTLFFLVIALILIYLIFVKYRNDEKRIKIAELFDKIALSFILIFPLALVLKKVIKRPRPNFFNHLVSEHGYSMPSGHAVAVTWIFLIITLLAVNIKNKLLKALAIFVTLILAALVIFSRIYFGVHYLSDVILGIVFTLVLSAVAFNLVSYKKSKILNAKEDK